MTAQDHNRTLGIIYGLLGGILATVLLVLQGKAYFNERAPGQFEDPFLPKAVPIGLVLALLFLFTAYGLFRRKSWGRILALIMAGLFIWLFPLGTMLAIYTWWFLHKEDAKQLYAKSLT